ncbi:hypothetical protein BJ875DRAFT_517929 [Amylocarpus encephaloides]|uniref:Uncharacterized protein n=1 Tax=Amylocarpus encephaloides TaxID=45428 RepID=A0A9P7YDS8_9HELO|nr:hypothetical protein BJ875DRAFT_517929 [Amylocarpus encephaloides]
MSSKLPRFEQSGKYDGGIPAEIWLDRLDYDFEVADQEDPTPTLYLRSISMLLIGEASRKFRCNSRMKAIMENRAIATSDNKAEVIEWLKTQYPYTDEEIEEPDVMVEVSELAQGPTESLLLHYDRVLALLKRTGTKDQDRALTDSSALKDNDKFILKSMTSAFVRGVRDDKLRTHALGRDVLVVPCLWKAYEILCMSSSAIQAQEKIEAEIEEKRHIRRMEEYIYAQTGVPAVVALSANRSLKSLRPLFHEV